MKEVEKSNRMLFFYITQDGKCYYCKEALWNGEVLTKCNIDHKQPSSKGGKDTIENTCLSCRECNTAKGSFSETEYTFFMEHFGKGAVAKKEATDYMKYLELKDRFEKKGMT